MIYIYLEKMASERTRENKSLGTTIVRIKRKLGEEAPNVITISSKRQRLDDASESVSRTVLQRLATVEKDDHLEQKLSTALRTEAKLSVDLHKNYKQRLVHQDTKELKKKIQSDKAAARFKLVCSKRKINLYDNESTEEDNVAIHLFDALSEDDEGSSQLKQALSREDVITCNGEPMQRTKVDYVYDLYYTSSLVEHSSWIENLCEIKPHNTTEFVNEDEDDESSPDDSEDDENEEDNWRNDYPDEDDLFEDEDDFICKQFAKANICNDSESYDEDEYDDRGDFDEHGNLISYGEPSYSTLRTFVKKQIQEEESADDTSEGEQLD